MNSKSKYEFSAQRLKNCLRAAIEKFQKNDANLMNNHCSERSQVHWLAIYFQEALEIEGFPFDHGNGYCFDVEYNRFGLTPGASKRLACICRNCEVNKPCAKQYDCDSSRAL